MDNAQAVERALDVLEYLSLNRTKLELSELCSRLTLPQNKVLFLVRILESKRYLKLNMEQQTCMLQHNELQHLFIDKKTLQCQIPKGLSETTLGTIRARIDCFPKELGFYANEVALKAEVSRVNARRYLVSKSILSKKN
ncbi:IclR-like helix-turn-helix domain-containing protein [Anaerospora hongkongensis]|uniref:IclR-like helix-turn-helix domain-containing protein n=1 Tax=Anaerospora hongkongensis TaxID=244830 RepID=A0A4R1Q2P7_9FIRM|nr:helix-turn-helix domain-containing protein [Anaerospora hongkongensis]TCL38830.1 IclR-like helix-turn-helix domain-containing protein [Anaerospora hongkongensis]